MPGLRCCMRNLWVAAWGIFNCSMWTQVFLRKLRTPNRQKDSVAIPRLPQRKNYTEVGDFWPLGMTGNRPTGPTLLPCPTAHSAAPHRPSWRHVTQQGTEGQTFLFIMVHSVTTDRHVGSGRSAASWRMVCVSQKQGGAVGTSRVQKQVTGQRPEDSRNWPRPSCTPPSSQTIQQRWTCAQPPLLVQFPPQESA